MADAFIQMAPYLEPAFEDLDPLVGELEQLLQDMLPEVDTLVGTGLSGALVVPYLGRKLGKHWGLVRKRVESAHSDRMFEGSLGENWIFVDDLFETGRTLRRVTSEIHELAKKHDHETWFMGMWGYDKHWGGWWPSEELKSRHLIIP